MLNRVFRFVAGLSASVAAVTLVGCAHPITLTPNNPQLSNSSPKIEKSVGYFISAENKALEVTTPGGGGDKVKYLPYKDLDPGLYKALSEVFTNVSKLDNPNDPAALASQGVTLVITPTITTTSSSDGAFTWPPTDFTVEFDCKVTDAKGNRVTQVKASGQGKATFSEFKSDFSLSARRASEDALANLVKALASSQDLRK